MKHCPKCGAACPRPGQKFCAQCGAPLSDMPPQAPAWPPAGAVRRKRLLVGGAAAVAVLLSVLAGLVWCPEPRRGPRRTGGRPGHPRAHRHGGDRRGRFRRDWTPPGFTWKGCRWWRA